MSIFNKEKLKALKQVDAAKKHTIMLVDDEAAQLTSLKSLISEEYNIITAKDGQEALEIIKNLEKPEEISVIVSDQRMPRLTGIQFFELLIEILPQAIRIILSGFLDIPVILEAISKARIYEFILKPFEPNDLQLRLRRAVEAFERQQELDEYRRDLEHIVNEKTKELHQKNKELEMRNKELEELSLTDELTGLRNIRYLKESIESDIARVDKYCGNAAPDEAEKESLKSNINFLILDLDAFRLLNNHHGNAAVVQVLKQLAEILRRNCCKSDILIRRGWDEFLVVNRFNSKDQAPVLAKRLKKAIEEYRFDLGGGKTEHLTCSIGFTSYPFLSVHDEKLNWEKVLDIAYKSLCYAKKIGGNTWVGIQSTDKTKPENLLNEINKSLEEFIGSGGLELLTSKRENRA